MVSGGATACAGASAGAAPSASVVVRTCRPDGGRGQRRSYTLIAGQQPAQRPITLRPVTTDIHRDLGNTVVALEKHSIEQVLQVGQGLTLTPAPHERLSRY